LRTSKAADLPSLELVLFARDAERRGRLVLQLRLPQGLLLDMLSVPCISPTSHPGFTFSLVLHANADLLSILRFFGSLFLVTWIDNNYYSTYCSSIVPGAANTTTGTVPPHTHKKECVEKKDDGHVWDENIKYWLPEKKLNAS